MELFQAQSWPLTRSNTESVDILQAHPAVCVGGMLQDAMGVYLWVQSSVAVPVPSTQGQVWMVGMSHGLQSLWDAAGQDVWHKRVGKCPTIQTPEVLKQLQKKSRQYPTTKEILPRCCIPQILSCNMPSGQTTECQKIYFGSFTWCTLQGGFSQLTGFFLGSLWGT